MLDVVFDIVVIRYNWEGLWVCEYDDVFMEER